MAHDLVELTPSGGMRLHMHSGQWNAWTCQKRFIAVISGTQGGKTSFGPHWLYREIQRRGPGDYMVVTPTFQLLEKKALPEFKRLFQQLLQLGEYVGSPLRKFTFSEDGAKRTFGYGPSDPEDETRRDDPNYAAGVPTQIFFCYAADPDSLESATAKAVWCDEAGQKRFKLASWEAILRRLSIHQGRALITTTPYDLGWLKQKIWDPWNEAKRKGQSHPLIEVIRFDSTENPNFPQAEFERARQDLPLWKFNLFYRGIFTRPAGLIYDSFDEERHKCPRFAIPDDWQRYMGIDFGGVNTAAVFYAEEPGTKKLYLYRVYHAGSRSAAEHTRELLKGEPMIPFCVGGSKSEGQWRREFRMGGMVDGKKVPGLPIHEPDIREVEVGIDRVYGAHKRNEIIVFDDLDQYFAEKMTYSRELNDVGEPTEEIEDKSIYHILDAERYIIGRIRRGA